MQSERQLEPAVIVFTVFFFILLFFSLFVSVPPQNVRLPRLLDIDSQSEANFLNGDVTFA